MVPSMTEGTGADAVLLDVADGVATVRLNRPERRNAWDDTLGEGMERVFSAVAVREDVRCVILAGEGAAFCAGADLLAGFPQLPSGHDDLRSTLRRRFHPGFLSLVDVPQPMIAAVHGPAIGAGACLALACDLLVIGRGAYLQFRFARIGLMPDVGATALLVEAVGRARALELLMFADPIDAATCAQLGLTNHVVDDAAVRERASSLAGRLAQGPTLAYATTKQAVRAWSSQRLAGQLELEAALQQTLARTEDWAEGRRAFRERRDPTFTGR
jgi:2-(1,2-epoxy-1,2-dihydrophenyl)acetyl-CoA isomerase